MSYCKDEALNRLATIGNVAQFLAFRSGAEPRESFSRIRGREPNASNVDRRSALGELITHSSKASINVRGYIEGSQRSYEFIYGLTSIDEAESAVARLLSEGLHVIVNETIDVCDGGVAGVVHGALIEFAPYDTPRCVEKPGVASLPLKVGLAILNKVYGVSPDVSSRPNDRVEFSFHPQPCGWLRNHTLLWEHESTTAIAKVPYVNWPNRFSKLIGNDVFGLLIADELRIPVPYSLVTASSMAPFEFGRETGTSETLVRVYSNDTDPGMRSTFESCTDAFRRMVRQESEVGTVASFIRQNVVNARWSGTASMSDEQTIFIKSNGPGAAGSLPSPVVSDVSAIQEVLSRQLGSVFIEWVHDGTLAWVTRLRRSDNESGPSDYISGAN